MTDDTHRTEPGTEAGRQLLSALVDDDWNEELTAPLIIAIENEAAERALGSVVVRPKVAD